jgi:hypothetical protein
MELRLPNPHRMGQKYSSGVRGTTRPTSLPNVFLTFALSGPLPPKRMGIILGIAVLLDALLVRLMLVPILLRSTGRAAGGCRNQLLALAGPACRRSNIVRPWMPSLWLRCCSRSGSP